MTLLKNAESGAKLKGLDVASVIIEHNQVNSAPKMHSYPSRAGG